MIIGSPYLQGVRGAVFTAEADYAAREDDLDVSLFVGAGEDHYTAVPRIISEGIRHLWADEAARLPSSWPGPAKQGHYAAYWTSEAGRRPCCS